MGEPLTPEEATRNIDPLSVAPDLYRVMNDQNVRLRADLARTLSALALAIGVAQTPRPWSHDTAQALETARAVLDEVKP